MNNQDIDIKEKNKQRAKEFLKMQRNNQKNKYIDENAKNMYKKYTSTEQDRIENIKLIAEKSIEVAKKSIEGIMEASSNNQSNYAETQNKAFDFSSMTKEKFSKDNTTVGNLINSLKDEGVITYELADNDNTFDLVKSLVSGINENLSKGKNLEELINTKLDPAKYEDSLGKGIAKFIAKNNKEIDYIKFGNISERLIKPITNNGHLNSMSVFKEEKVNQAIETEIARRVDSKYVDDVISASSFFNEYKNGDKQNHPIGKISRNETISIDEARKTKRAQDSIENIEGFVKELSTKYGVSEEKIAEKFPSKIKDVMYNKNKGEFDYNNKINRDSLDVLKNLDIDVNTGSYSKRPVANDTTPKNIFENLEKKQGYNEIKDYSKTSLEDAINNIKGSLNDDSPEALKNLVDTSEVLSKKGVKLDDDTTRFLKTYSSALSSDTLTGENKEVIMKELNGLSSSVSTGALKKVSKENLEKLDYFDYKDGNFKLKENIISGLTDADKEEFKEILTSENIGKENINPIVSRFNDNKFTRRMQKSTNNKDLTYSDIVNQNNDFISKFNSDSFGGIEGVGLSSSEFLKRKGFTEKDLTSIKDGNISYDLREKMYGFKVTDDDYYDMYLGEYFDKNIKSKNTDTTTKGVNTETKVNNISDNIKNTNDINPNNRAVVLTNNNVSEEAKKTVDDISDSIYETKKNKYLNNAFQKGEGVIVTPYEDSSTSKNSSGFTSIEYNNSKQPPSYREIRESEYINNSVKKGEGVVVTPYKNDFLSIQYKDPKQNPSKREIKESNYIKNSVQNGEGVVVTPYNLTDKEILERMKKGDFSELGDIELDRIDRIRQNAMGDKEILEHLHNSDFNNVDKIPINRIERVVNNNGNRLNINQIPAGELRNQDVRYDPKKTKLANIPKREHTTTRLYSGETIVMGDSDFNKKSSSLTVKDRNVVSKPLDIENIKEAEYVGENIDDRIRSYKESFKRIKENKEYKEKLILNAEDKKRVHKESLDRIKERKNNKNSKVVKEAVEETPKPIKETIKEGIQENVNNKINSTKEFAESLGIKVSSEGILGKGHEFKLKKDAFKDANELKSYLAKLSDADTDTARKMFGEKFDLFEKEFKVTEKSLIDKIVDFSKKGVKKYNSEGKSGFDQMMEQLANATKDLGVYEETTGEGISGMLKKDVRKALEIDNFEDTVKLFNESNELKKVVGDASKSGSIKSITNKIGSKGSWAIGGAGLIVGTIGLSSLVGNAAEERRRKEMELNQLIIATNQGYRGAY